MKPFFPYMGSKWLLAPKYGAPRHPTTIEPFAGSAAYSVRHDDKADWGLPFLLLKPDHRGTFGKYRSGVSPEYVYMADQ